VAARARSESVAVRVREYVPARSRSSAARVSRRPWCCRQRRRRGCARRAGAHLGMIHIHCTGEVYARHLRDAPIRQHHLDHVHSRRWRARRHRSAQSGTRSLPHASTLQPEAHDPEPRTGVRGNRPGNSEARAHPSGNRRGKPVDVRGLGDPCAAVDRLLRHRPSIGASLAAGLGVRGRATAPP
jgi:hypothetical protein